MTASERSGLRTAATLGLAVFGPLTLLSGLLTFVTIPTGVPAFLAGVFVFALAGTVLCLVVYLVDDARRRV
jgi:hypothetical protein